MAITTCVVSGTIKDLSATAIQDITVEAYNTTPFFHTDGTLLPPFKVMTTTAADGTWSLTLAETATISKTITIAFLLPTGSVERIRREYTVNVPNQGSVAFDTLVTGQ